MDKQKVTGTIWVYDTPYGKTQIFTHPMDGQPGYVFRGELEVTVEVGPIDKDKVAQDLRKSVEDVKSEAAATVQAIMQQIEDVEAAGDE